MQGPRRGLELCLLALFALVVNAWLKWLIAAPRPYFLDAAVSSTRATPGFGMPSGHAQGAAAVFGGLAVMSRRRPWVVVLALLIFLVGLSRVVLGVHSPDQVLVGWLLGFASVYVFYRLAANRMSRLTALRPIVFMVLLAAVIAAIHGMSELILAWRADFVAPETWLQNYRVASGDAGVTREFMTAMLLRNDVTFLLALGGGFLLSGYLLERRALTLPTRGAQASAFVLAIICVATFVALIGAFGFSAESDPATLLAVAVLQPVVGVFVPYRTTCAILSRRRGSAAT